MTNRERMECALRGGTPDRVPFTTYEWMFGPEDKDFNRLVERGLGVTRHYETCLRKMPDVTFEDSTFERDGHKWTRRVMRTPVGELEELYADNWRQEFYIKKPRDYKVIEFIARHTMLEPNYEGFNEQREQMGERGAMIVAAYRSPIQEIMVELVGIGNFCYHLADGVQELYSCHEAMMTRALETCRIIAAGPGEFVKLWENYSAEPFGSARFAEFHMPFYRNCGELLHAAGKRLMAHTDGKIARTKDELNRAGLDILESLTPPAEGDVPPELWRDVWPELAFWVNVPVSWYFDPPEKLAWRLDDLLDRVDSRRGLLLEISEDLPSNWRESLPVVLEVLERRSRTA
jgi:hypothetical protein